MRTIAVLIVLATLVLTVVAVVLWPTLWSNASTWETALLIGVDAFGVLWFVSLLALAISSFRSTRKAAPANSKDPRSGLKLVE